ncbi:MAG: type II secretion system protein GspG [Phycisphaerales bacterium]|jgi:general secretion pathway protein G
MVGKNMKYGRLAATRSGFSLIELLLVLAIIGVLMAVAAVNLTGWSERAKIKATKASLQTLQTALNGYNVEYSSYPPTLSTLSTVKPAFIDDTKKLKDGWDMDFYYSPQGRGERPYSLGSYGNDKQPGTEDDLDIWTMNK